MDISYSIIQQENEYRILLTPVDITVLPDQLQKTIVDRNIDISELIIDRISGESTTRQTVLHDFL